VRRGRGSLFVLRFLLWTGATFAVLPIPFLLVYRFVPPPLTPLMAIRSVQGEPIEKTWRPYGQISPKLFRAVIASEDARFCDHGGFDWPALRHAWAEYQEGKRTLGASTITMQTAKNLFLWPGRSFVRKAYEAYVTALLELLWSKTRIIEVYANIIEWGHGIYGAEEAARAYFRKEARQLTVHEAALLAAVLPNPRRWSAGRPTAYIEERARTIAARMDSADAASATACP
jgi:monofunctional biosynthetic peptidoglycan transglycosylase